MPTEPDQDYLFEFVRIGNSVKVSAIDPVTGLEAAIIGPASAGENILSRQAMAKLKYIMGKDQQPSRIK